MKNHQIEFSDLKAWLEETTVVYASSTKDQKRLECSLKGTFIVKHKDKIVYQTTQPYSAMEEYNKI